MNSWLFLSLILAHVIGDFYLQNDKYCTQKEERKFKSWFLYVHSLIIGVVSWVVVPVYEFRFYALAIAFSHLVIDVIKTYSPKGLWNFVIDQIVHWAILIIVTSSFDTTTKLPIQSMDCNGSFSIPLFILAILLCIKPANILIKLVLKKYQVGETQSCENIKNAGKSRKTKCDGREKRKAIFEAKTKCAQKSRLLPPSGQNTSVVQTPFESCLNDAFLLNFPLKYHLKPIANLTKNRIFI